MRFHSLARNGERSLLENLIWLAVLATSLSLCAVLLKEMNTDWDSNPV
jgi:hypothetical protein